MAYDELNPELLNPGVIIVDRKGAAVSGGRTYDGETSVANFGGSGKITVSYLKCLIDPSDADVLRYLSWLGMVLNDGIDKMIVPLLIDRIVPYYDPTATYLTAPHSDDAPFSDDSEYLVNTLTARVTANATYNDAYLYIEVTGGKQLYGGEWFSIDHGGVSHRLYGIRQVVETGDADAENTRQYKVRIRPTLRADTAADTPVEFNRPKCLMMLPPGKTIPFTYEAYGESHPELEFVEAPLR